MFSSASVAMGGQHPWCASGHAWIAHTADGVGEWEIRYLWSLSQYDLRCLVAFAGLTGRRPSVRRKMTEKMSNYRTTASPPRHSVCKPLPSKLLAAFSVTLQCGGQRATAGSRWRRWRRRRCAECRGECSFMSPCWPCGLATPGSMSCRGRR